MVCSGPTESTIGSPGEQNICKQKCKLSFSYTPTSLVAKKHTDYGYIEFKPRDPNISVAVQYKSINYVPINFMVFNKPIHNFYTMANEPVGELIICHMKEGSSSEKLYICIPIQAIKDHPKSGKLGTILSKTVNITDAAVIQLSNFKFSDFIPKKTYYNYTGTPLYKIQEQDDDICETKCEYVVFSTVDSALYLSPSEVSALYNLGEHKITKYKNDNISLSDLAPGLMNGDDIWIDCTPVGNSGSEYVPISDSGGGVDFLKNISVGSLLTMLTPYISIIIGVLLMLGIWKLGNYLYSPKCKPTGALCDLSSGKSHKCK